jgi:hypothetical protein
MFKVSGMVQQNKVAHRLGAQRRGRETGGSYIFWVAFHRISFKYLQHLSLACLQSLTEFMSPCQEVGIILPVTKVWSW